MPRKALPAALINIPHIAAGPALLASAGYHGFGTAIVSHPRTATCWHIICQLERPARWCHNDGTLLLRPGHLCVIEPGHTFHGADGIDHPNAHCWFNVDPTVASRHDRSVLHGADRHALHAALRAGAGRCHPFTGDLAQALRDLVGLLPPSATPYAKATLNLALDRVLVGIAVSLGGEAPPSADHAVQTALGIIEHNVLLGEKVSVSDLAAASKLSATVFSRRFKAATGRPPAEFVIWRRARLAIAHPQRGATVTAAAIDTGFSSSQHFATCCRRLFRRSPSALAQEP
ncbi:MAG: AraC family transcriptional regulator [Planctomycetota bacterium]|jgi:AraC-like DNA-binding protein|nr:AraC family transcriptional regulator [Planctomycetota bacterium]